MLFILAQQVSEHNVLYVWLPGPDIRILAIGNLC